MSTLSRALTFDTVILSIEGMDQESFSVQELANRANQLCREKGIQPLSRQASAAVSVRNIRYYQSLGLIDAPFSRDGRGYSEIHLRQLTAIRALQAQGLPLAQISSHLASATSTDLPLTPSLKHLQWQTIAIAPDIFLLVQSGRTVLPAQREEILRVLGAVQANPQTLTTAIQPEEGFRPETD